MLADAEALDDLAVCDNYVHGGRLYSEGLYLDVWISADGRTILRLDEDEFAASGLAERDPAQATAAVRAFEELVRLAHRGFRGKDANSSNPYADVPFP